MKKGALKFSRRIPEHKFYFDEVDRLVKDGYHIQTALRKAREKYEHLLQTQELIDADLKKQYSIKDDGLQFLKKNGFTRENVITARRIDKKGSYEAYIESRIEKIPGLNIPVEPKTELYFFDGKEWIRIK